MADVSTAVVMAVKYRRLPNVAKKISFFYPSTHVSSG